MKKRAKSKSKSVMGRSSAGKLQTYGIGDVVVIRAIPFHYIGTIEAMSEHTVTLSAGAVWLADSSRWHDFLKTGKVNEAEPYIDAVEIGFGVIADITKWRHSIPGQV